MKKVTCIACTAALVLGFAGLAFASEGGQSMGANFTWRLLNLVAFVAIIWFAVGKMAKAFFAGRRQGIAQELENLEQRKKDAELHLAEIETRLANLEQERKAILDESRAQAETIVAAMLVEAEKQAVHIKEQAQRAAENEARAILADVRAAVADELVLATETLLRQRLDAATQDQLIEKSLAKVVLN